MARYAGIEKSDASAVGDSTDTFPLIKSVASAAMRIKEISQVRHFFFHHTISSLEQGLTLTPESKLE
jgi:hypothetical protein